jgi:catechol 2,3-dioxygenase
MITIKELGHVVLYVTNLDVMVDFYNRVLGFNMLAKRPGMAVFSTGRTHHELLLIEIGGKPEPKNGIKPGLYHIGFKIGDTKQDLLNAIETIEAEGVVLIGAADHAVTNSLYILDPDGNELELYIDTGDEWKNNDQLVLTPTKPLKL